MVVGTVDAWQIVKVVILALLLGLALGAILNALIVLNQMGAETTPRLNHEPMTSGTLATSNIRPAQVIQGFALEALWPDLWDKIATLAAALPAALGAFVTFMTLKKIAA